MIHGRCKHVIVSIATGGMLVVVLFLLLNATSQTAYATPADLFVSPAGSGHCAQSNPCNLQTALNQAMDGDNLYLSHGVYTGTGGSVITLTKSIGLYGGWDGSTITPIVRNSNTYLTTLDGEHTRRVIHITGTNSSTIDGFVITGGESYEGGGIYINKASPIIQNNVIASNRTIKGGLYHYGMGGGIFVIRNSQAVISNNIIYNNTSWKGGGIYHDTYNDIAITITMNEIISNMASFTGGGVFSSYAPDIIHSNVISGNTSGMSGGGMMLWGSDAQVDGNFIMNNKAVDGGGIYIAMVATPSLFNNLLVNNSVDGIYIEHSYPVIVNNTIVAQSINSGSGLFLTSFSDCEPESCIMGNYLNNIIMKYQYGILKEGPVIPILDYNDVWSNSLNNYSLPVGIETGPHSISENPGFVSTELLDFHLSSTSPCINAGYTGTELLLPLTDIDGQPRLIGGRVDIGAYEFGSSHFLPVLLR